MLFWTLAGTWTMSPEAHSGGSTSRSGVLLNSEATTGPELTSKGL